MTTDTAKLPASLYERDFYAWANEQAALLRAGKFAAADIESVAEEIESMGRSERRELTSRLTVLLTHLLKWRVQPDRRGRSWLLTILEQRREAASVLNDNPSLRRQLPDIIANAYETALLVAQRETDLPKTAFPVESPWTYDQAMQGEPSSEQGG